MTIGIIVSLVAIVWSSFCLVMAIYGCIKVQKSLNRANRERDRLMIEAEKELERLLAKERLIDQSLRQSSIFKN